MFVSKEKENASILAMKITNSSTATKLRVSLKDAIYWLPMDYVTNAWEKNTNLLTVRRRDCIRIATQDIIHEPVGTRKVSPWSIPPG